MSDRHQSNSLSPQLQNALVKSALTQDAAISWTIANSAELYNIKGWGEPYFAINQAGNVTVSPSGNSDHKIDLAELVESLKKRDLNLPLLIRFPDIIGDRIARLDRCMKQAIARYNYTGTYRGVFPIKCNQNRHLIEALVERGKQYHFGLEAGSKPELAIALAVLESPTASKSLSICNGYKDREYIETALLATKLSQKPIIIIEQLQELDLVLKVSQKLQIEPAIGIRAKLNARGIGRWEDSTGDRAKFGLSVAEILQVVQRLETAEKLDCLQLLHFHIGSQISAIEVIKNAIREASQIYVQLVKLGAKMQYLNVGGGLAVDYDGSKTNTAASKNYNMQNYANDLVAQVRDACDSSGITHPTLISESGRAIAAHQSLLVFDVLNVSTPQRSEIVPETNIPLVIKNFWETYRDIEPANLQESYHDAIQFKQEALSLFNLGYLSLSDRAQAEELYWACCQRISTMLTECDDVPDELADLPQIMAATYYVNLSIFRSIPDAWAIDQLFPIMPIHRLNEKPSCQGILADITCDSDGKIDRFINRKTAKKVLELHPVNDAPYYLGMFLIGAYQEIMGNLHNLFGDTNVVHIKTTPTGYQVESVVRGDTVERVLNHVQYDSRDLLETMRRRTEAALQDRRITLAEARKLLQNYANTLKSYTYLNDFGG